jgi:quinol-cytochrome oxidoreductase complex cytochrome b subunit
MIPTPRPPTASVPDLSKGLCPPGITVPEWYLTGLYAFLRTGYDKFVTGVGWPGLLILTLAIMPFIDRYKKFSWKDRPLVTAIGITSIAQIIVTTYWLLPPQMKLLMSIHPPQLSPNGLLF